MDQMQKLMTKNAAAINASAKSIHEILSFASVIQRESDNFDDMATIGGVFQNRLEQNMKLQSDATVHYFLNTSTFRLSIADTQKQSPFNLYLNTGLTPGPIATVSENALDAAIYPEAHNYLYFLADIEGNTYFAETYEEHLINKEKYVDTQ